MAFDNILIISLNSVIQRYGGPEQGIWLLTCATIVQSFMLIITMPLSGITTGTQTILGYNLGARKPERIIRAEKNIVFLCLVFTTIMFVIAHTVPEYFVRIFTRDEAYVKVTVDAIKVYTPGSDSPCGPVHHCGRVYGDGDFLWRPWSLSTFRKAIFFLCVFCIPPFFRGGKCVLHRAGVRHCERGLLHRRLCPLLPEADRAEES